MDIVYLDQNKWIDLARVYSSRITEGPIARLYDQLARAVDREQVLFPLSASHVLETSKRNDPVSRGWVAETQAKFSRGYVYRSRAGRLEVEIRVVLQRLFGSSPPDLSTNWALAHGFLQAFEPMDESIAAPDRLQRMMRTNASMPYVDFMKNQDDHVRRMTHSRLVASAERLVAQIEARRAWLAGDSVDLRRRAYKAQLFLDNQDTILRILGSLGYTFEQLRSLGERAVVALVEDVPTLNVEAEMSSRLEAEGRRVEPNDLLDMQSFYTAIPYSSRVIAEKASVSRAKQARLDKRYAVSLSASLLDLLDAYR